MSRDNGRSVGAKVGTWWSCPFIVFPFILATSSPYMSIDCLASSMATQQFWIKLFLRAKATRATGGNKGGKNWRWGQKWLQSSGGGKSSSSSNWWQQRWQQSKVVAITTTMSGGDKWQQSTSGDKSSTSTVIQGACRWQWHHCSAVAAAFGRPFGISLS